jgi:hypothetical protein
LDRVCHGHDRPGCGRDPIPWDSARNHCETLSNSAPRRPLVFLLAGPPLKHPLRTMVFVPPSPLRSSGCGVNLCRRASLWNHQRHGPRTFGELVSLFHSPLVLRNPVPDITAIRPGLPRYASKTSPTIRSNLLTLHLLFRTWLTRHGSPQISLRRSAREITIIGELFGSRGG